MMMSKGHKCKRSKSNTSKRNARSRTYWHNGDIDRWCWWWMVTGGYDSGWWWVGGVVSKIVVMIVCIAYGS